MSPTASLPLLDPPLFKFTEFGGAEELTPLTILSTASSSIDVAFASDTNYDQLPAFVVMKFGGTSIARHLSTIVKTIVPSQGLSRKRIPVLVCSAQSYTAKSEGTTQCLLDAIDAAVHSSTRDSSAETLAKLEHPSRTAPTEPFTPPPTPPQTDSPPMSTRVLLPLGTDQKIGSTSQSVIIDKIFERHCLGARSLLSSLSCSDDGGQLIIRKLENELRGDCDRVIRLLDAVQTLGEISSQTRDKIVSVGELMSCRTVVAALESRNIPARLVDLTDLDVPVAIKPSRKSLDPYVAGIRRKLIPFSFETGEKQPVLVATGFFGRVPGSLLDFIGRGYTDVCAALCARALRAEELQIWKEVDGVFTADPRKVSSACLLPEITSSQAKLLTAYGSEVIHHGAIDQAICARIPIIVKNVVNPTGAGTRVDTTASVVTVQHSTFHAESTRPSALPHPIFAVTILNDLELVDVCFANPELAPSRHPLAIVLDAVRQDEQMRDIGVDLITSSQDEVSFVVTRSCSDRKNHEVTKTLKKLQNTASVTVTPQMSYLQVVFDHADRPSVTIEVMKALTAAYIEIAKISHRRRGDGVGFVIQTSVALSAAKIVHDTLLG